MTLETLAIHTEAWLQEELGAQRAVLTVLERLEAAARMAGRRVAAVARYHGGLLEDLSRLLLAEAPGSAASGERHLVDARA